MIRKVIVLALIALAVFVGVTRFAVPAGAQWRYSWRIWDFVL